MYNNFSHLIDVITINSDKCEFNVINDVSDTSLKELCYGCLLHYDNVANYHIHSNKSRLRLSPWESEGLGTLVARQCLFGVY